MSVTTEIAYSHPDLDECLAGYAKASGQPMPEVVALDCLPNGVLVARFNRENMILSWNGIEWCLKRVVTAKEVGGG